MPELPFVEVIREHLERLAAGRRIDHVTIRSPSVLKTYDPPVDALVGQVITAVRRRGKMLVIEAADLALVLHLMKNGRVQRVPPDAKGKGPSRDVALVLGLDDHSDLRLVEIGPKKRASVWVVARDRAGVSRPLADLGLDPFDPGFTPAALAEMLRGERQALKRFLGQQRFVVGIGNAFGDEILWEARLSPLAMTTALGDADVAALHAAILSTLRRGLEEHRVAFRDALPIAEPLHLLRVHRHAKEPCPRCGTPIAAIYYADRETYYCPSCQTGGKVYADRRLSRLLR